MSLNGIRLYITYFQFSGQLKPKSSIEWLLNEIFWEIKFFHTFFTNLNEFIGKTKWKLGQKIYNQFIIDGNKWFIIFAFVCVKQPFRIGMKLQR